MAEAEAISPGDAAHVKLRTAFVAKVHANLSRTTVGQFCKALVEENDAGLVPEFVYNDYKSFRLIYFCEQQREKAFQTKLRLFSQVVPVDLPVSRPVVKKRTLHLSNIPITV